MTNSDEIHPSYYEEAQLELNECRQQATWIKQLALSDGDEDKARFGYIRSRAVELANTSTALLPNFSSTKQTPGETKTQLSKYNESTRAVWVLLVGGFIALWVVRTVGYTTMHDAGLIYSFGANLFGPYPYLYFPQMLIVHSFWILIAATLTLRFGSIAAKIVLGAMVLWFALVAYGSWDFYLRPFR